MKVFIKDIPLRRLLIRNNFSQNSFAVEVGISSGYISQIITGVRNTGPDLRKKILEKLNVKFDDLFEIVE